MSGPRQVFHVREGQQLLRTLEGELQEGEYLAFLSSREPYLRARAERIFSRVGGAEEAYGVTEHVMREHLGRPVTTVAFPNRNVGRAAVFEEYYHLHQARSGRWDHVPE